MLCYTYIPWLVLHDSSWKSIAIPKQVLSGFCSVQELQTMCYQLVNKPAKLQFSDAEWGLVKSYLCYEETVEALLGNLQKPLSFLSIYCMEQSPSWKANQFSASQEIHQILWNLKVHDHIHKCSPPIPILKFLIMYRKMPTYLTFSRLKSHMHFVFIYLQL